jgi:lipopolysaccharide export system permease protein
MAKEGTWGAFEGMWLSTFILLPIAVFLIYKATRDSNLFNAEWYIMRYRAVKNLIHGLFGKYKHI